MMSTFIVNYSNYCHTEKFELTMLHTEISSAHHISNILKEGSFRNMKISVVKKKKLIFILCHVHINDLKYCKKVPKFMSMKLAEAYVQSCYEFIQKYYLHKTVEDCRMLRLTEFIIFKSSLFHSDIL